MDKLKNMNQQAFDNKKYLKEQEKEILKRIDRFGDKLYLEFGGKIINDYHGSRVLPGYDPNIKVYLLEKLREKDTDIFCLQEVFNNSPHIKSKVSQDKKQDIYKDIEKALVNFDGHMASSQEGEESLCMWVRKDFGIQKIADHYVYRWKNAMEGNDASTYGINVQYAKFNKNEKDFMICNLYGHWTPNFKGDNPARLEQSQNIKSFLDSFKGARILCGDFNVAPDTKSMEILETSMNSLVKEYRVTTTRSHFYTKEHKFADYILVSPEIKVKKFEVIQDVVSDHLPLMLEFG